MLTFYYILDDYLTYVDFAFKSDVGRVIEALYGSELPPIVLIGHRYVEYWTLHEYLVGYVLNYFKFYLNYFIFIYQLITVTIFLIEIK